MPSASARASAWTLALTSRAVTSSPASGPDGVGHAADRDPPHAGTRVVRHAGQVEFGAVLVAGQHPVQRAVQALPELRRAVGQGLARGRARPAEHAVEHRVGPQHPQVRIQAAQPHRRERVDRVELGCVRPVHGPSRGDGRGRDRSGHCRRRGQGGGGHGRGGVPGLGGRHPGHAFVRDARRETLSPFVAADRRVAAGVSTDGFTRGCACGPGGGPGTRIATDGSAAGTSLSSRFWPGWGLGSSGCGLPRSFFSARPASRRPRPGAPRGTGIALGITVGRQPPPAYRSRRRSWDS